MASWARGLLEPLGLVAGSLDSWSLGRALGGGFGSLKCSEESLEAAGGLSKLFRRALGGDLEAR